MIGSSRKGIALVELLHAIPYPPQDIVHSVFLYTLVCIHTFM